MKGGIKKLATFEEKQIKKYDDKVKHFLKLRGKE
jgi:hypothetical protein